MGGLFSFVSVQRFWNFWRLFKTSSSSSDMLSFSKMVRRLEQEREQLRRVTPSEMRPLIKCPFSIAEYDFPDLDILVVFNHPIPRLTDR